ncbi:hypothetical protein RHS03_05687, partial [Rhizoctonia solani]
MAPHRIFTVTELLSLICVNCDNPTRTILARTSRLWFEIATPILWGNLQGAHKIFQLIPGAVIGRIKPTEPPPKDPRLYLDAVDFTRFNIYAPRVKHLTIYDPLDKKLRIETWYNWGFIHYLYQQQTLFPNLMSLVINQPTIGGSSSRRHNPPAYEQWITAFSSETLLTVQAPLTLRPGLPPHLPSVPLTTASAAVARLAIKSKSLRTLEIYPTVSSAELNSMGQGAIFGGFIDPETPYQRFCNSFESLTQLSELSITAIAFETSMFRVLANLPHLKSLLVHIFSYQLPEFHPELVPTSSFPQLVKLSLFDIDQETLEKIWESQPLVGKLTSLTILSYHSRQITLDWARETFLPILRTCSPELTEFLCESRSPGKGAEFDVKFSLGALDLKPAEIDGILCFFAVFAYVLLTGHLLTVKGSRYVSNRIKREALGYNRVTAIRTVNHPLMGRLRVTSPPSETETLLRLYYTTVKALALSSLSRPALPVEVILCICQLAGFVDPWPNRSLYAEVAFDRGAVDTSIESGSSNEIRPWLCSPPLSSLFLKKAWRAEPCIHPAEPVMSRTHAFRPDELIVRIARDPFNRGYKTDSEGRELGWKYLTTGTARQPITPLRTFDHCHEIWEWIEPGDSIEVAVDAAGWYFPNIRSEWGVSLRIYTLWEPSEAMLRLIYKCDS